MKRYGCPAWSVWIAVLCVFAATAFAAGGGPGFRNQQRLEAHFEKHGREFGNIDRQQYLRMAQQLRDAKPGREILETKRPNGGGSKFDRARGYFVAFDHDGTIRTFFMPVDGERYFRRQARRYDERQ